MYHFWYSLFSLNLIFCGYGHIVAVAMVHSVWLWYNISLCKYVTNLFSYYSVYGYFDHFHGFAILECCHEYTYQCLIKYTCKNFAWKHTQAWTYYGNLQFYKIMSNCFLILFYKFTFPFVIYESFGVFLDPCFLHPFVLVSSYFWP